jgi:glycosyltransferase involved in cell wall biosynthesis
VPSVTTPLVSIIIPLFNAARWLRHALDSALNQTWSNTEIIVVDDGSTDDSLLIARSYCCSRVNVLTQSNAGAASARNRALQIAQGDYIQYLDADDLLSATKIAAQIAVLREAPSHVLGVCDSCYFADGTAPLSGHRVEGWPAVHTDSPLDWLIDLYSGDHGASNMVPVGSWLVPRSVSDRAGKWDEHCLVDDDGEYFCRIVLAGCGIRTASDVYYFCRRHTAGASLSGTFSRRHLLSAMYAQDRKAEHILRRRNDLRTRKALSRLYVDHAVAAYPFCREATEYGLMRARELDPQYKIPTLSGRTETLRRLAGWKVARLCRVFAYFLKGVIARALLRLFRLR